MSNILEEKSQAIEANTQVLTTQARSLKIADEVGEGQAIDLLAKISASLKRLEDLRKQATQPLVDQKRATDNLAKMHSEPLTLMQAAIKAALKAYMDEKARVAEAEAARIRKIQEEKEAKERAELLAAQKAEAAAEQKRRDAEREAEMAKTKKARDAAQKKADEARKMAEAAAQQAQEAQQALDTKEIVMIEEAPKSVRTANGAMATRKMRWVWETVDINALIQKRPDLLMIDEVKINQLIKAGERELPGIRIYQESEISSRS